MEATKTVRKSPSSHKASQCFGSKFKKRSSYITMDLTSEEEALFVAISFGKIHRIASLLEMVDDLGIRSADHSTPLIHTSQVTQGELCSHVTRLLLKRKNCDVNAQDRNGMTALMYACSNKQQIDTARILARNRFCDVNIADQNGFTALMHAVTVGNLDAAEILLFCPQVAHKADVNVHNLEGSTAVDLAVKSKNKAFCNLLVKKAGADITHVHDITHLNNLLKKA